MNIKFINDSIRLFISDICNRFLRQKNALKFKNILFFFTINSKEQSSSWETNRFLSQWRDSPNFMEPDASLPYSQQPATCP